MQPTSGLLQSREKYTIANPPPAGHDAVGDFFWGLFLEAKHEKIERLQLHQRWTDLHALWRGKKKIAKYPYIGANYVFKTVHGHCAALTQSAPQFDVSSKDVEDEEAQKTATILQREAEDWWQTKEIQDLLFSHAQDMQVYGTAILKGRWDFEQDDAAVDLVDLYSFFPAPGYRRCKVQELPYCCEVAFMPVWRVREKWGVDESIAIEADAEAQLLGKEREEVHGWRAKLESALGRTPSNFATISNIAGALNPLKQEAMVVEVWFKDKSVSQCKTVQTAMEPALDEAGNPIVDDMGRPIMNEVQTEEVTCEPVYPDGIRKITLCNGGKLILDDSQNPNINWELVVQMTTEAVKAGANSPEGAVEEAIEIHSKSHLWGKYPYIAAPSLVDNTQWWGFAIIEQLSGLQGKSEALLTKIHAYFDRLMFPILVNPRGSGVKKSDFTNAPGLIIEPNLTHAPAIGYVNPPPPPQGIFDLLDFTISTIDVVSLSPEVMQGRRPKGISAASAIIALQDKASMVAQPQVRQIDKTIREMGRMVISLKQQFGTKPKKIIIDDETIEYRGIDLQGAFEMEVESGSSAPITKAGRRNMYLELFKMGACDLETVLKNLEVPNYKQIVEKITEQTTLPGAIKVLIQAGLPEDYGLRLLQILSQPQRGANAVPVEEQMPSPEQAPPVSDRMSETNDMAMEVG